MQKAKQKTPWQNFQIQKQIPIFILQSLVILFRNTSQFHLTNYNPNAPRCLHSQWQQITVPLQHLYYTFYDSICWQIWNTKFNHPLRDILPPISLIINVVHGCTPLYMVAFQSVGVLTWTFLLLRFCRYCESVGSLLGLDRIFNSVASQ